MAKEKIEVPPPPLIPVKHWWSLRNKFKQSIPGTVTDNYLATTLNIAVISARTNVLPYLKTLGLIDSEGKTGDLAKKWRDDKQYTPVCESIRKKVYSAELISAVSKPSEDREAVERWFANHTGAGTTAVRRMAAIYTVISEADLSKTPKAKDASDGKIKTKTKTKTKKKPAAKSKSPTGGESSSESLAQGQLPPPSAPGVSINLEIHVSSDATPDQIDKIFESMARHIYKK